MGSTTLKAAPLWEIWQLRKTFSQGKASSPQSYLCGLSGQLGVLQTPRGGDWTLGPTRAGAIFSPLHGQ